VGKGCYERQARPGQCRSDCTLLGIALYDLSRAIGISDGFWCWAPSRSCGRRKGALCDWLAALRARKPPKVVAVALANKLARIVWAIITTGEAFRTSIYAKA